MDNQNSNKKRPFGRDDRSGRSFFRARREGAVRSDDNQASGERSERPAYKKEATAHKPFRPASGGPRRDDKPHYGNREDRGAREYKPRFDKKDDNRGNREYKPRFDKKDDNRGSREYKPRFEKKDDNRGTREFKPRFDRSDKPRFEKRDDRGYKPRFDRKDGDRPAYAKRERKPRYEESAPVMPDEMRLNRFIAMSGVCSRREADQLIEAGEVTVNGVMVDQLGSKVHPATDEVRLNGELLKGEKKVYILLNKPKGYVTTVEDPHADRTVIDLLKGECKERIYPVGRLDKNTTGVLLLTNDGNLTKELTHPSFAKKKIYHVFLDKPCTEADLEKLASGLELEDGPIHADEVSFVDDKGMEVGVELHSGRNRIVRRMFESLGYDVVKLDRVYFAGLTKMGLRRGFWRYLTPREVSALKTGSYE